MKRKTKTVPVDDVTVTPVDDVTVTPVDDVTVTPVELGIVRVEERGGAILDTSPIVKALVAAGLDGRIDVSDGIRVTFGGVTLSGATVAEVAEAIRTYNCRECATGGGHAAWCERRPR